MIIRRSIVPLAVLAVSACSQIFPGTKKGTDVTSLQPRVQKTGARRREGSDVTMPKSADPGRLVSTLIPCDAADSAAVKPRVVTECQHVDPKGDILRPQMDTSVGKRP
jgi:hypothetical protein